MHQRAGWGALGAILPLALRLAGEAHVYEKASSLRIPGMVDILVPMFISILAGAAVAAVFQDEKNRRNLLVLGISAPAMINTWAAYGTASQAERNLENLKGISNQSADAGSGIPISGTSPSPHSLFRFNMVQQVFAADQSLSTFTHAEPTTLQKIQSAVTGSIPNKDYFVVLGSFSSVDDAQREKLIAQGKLPGYPIEVYGPPPGYAPALFSVVLAPNLTIEDAKTYLEKAQGAGYSSSYIWTFGIPQRPATVVPPSDGRLHTKPGLNRVPDEWVSQKPVWIAIQPKKSALLNTNEFIWIVLIPKKPDELKSAEPQEAITRVLIDAADSELSGDALLNWIEKNIPKVAPRLDTLIVNLTAINSTGTSSAAEWSSDISIGKQMYEVNVRPEGARGYAVLIHAKAEPSKTKKRVFK